MKTYSIEGTGGGLFVRMTDETGSHYLLKADGKTRREFSTHQGLYSEMQRRFPEYEYN